MRSFDYSKLENLKIDMEIVNYLLKYMNINEDRIFILDKSQQN